MRFSHPASITYLEIDNLQSEEELYIFENLTTLVWNNAFRPGKNLVLVRDLIGGRLKRLAEFHMNLTRFESTMQLAALMETEKIRYFYTKLMDCRSKIGDQLNFKIWINGVPLDLNMPNAPMPADETPEIWKYAQWEAFDGYHFANPLIDCHLINFTFNQTPLQPCSSVFKTDYRVLEQRIFDLQQPAPIPDASDSDKAPPNQLPPPEFNLALFHRQYPNIRVVTLDRREFQIPYNFNAFVRFVSQCRALTSLELYHSDLPFHLYLKLFAPVETGSQRVARLSSNRFCFSDQLAVSSETGHKSGHSDRDAAERCEDGDRSEIHFSISTFNYQNERG